MQKIYNAPVTQSVKDVFQQNGNEPMKVRDISERVQKLMPEYSIEVIAKKMVVAVRPAIGLLTKVEYGKYQLKKD